MKQIRYTYMDSLIGRLLVAAHDQGLAALRFCEGPKAKGPEPDWNEDPTIARETREELRAYFAGELRHFQSQLHPEGSPFQLAVWAKLCEIRYGATISYGELASMIGNPQASRAVGLANGANPIPIIIPCHRVIGSNGKLTGYGGGLAIKEKLLALEQGGRLF
jgi:methylated-DNA-[protein]-cysteine S-methyltransferase